MLDNLKALAKDNSNFVNFRWDNPLHNDYSTEQQSRTWPSGEDFFHPLNPMFSYFFKTYEHLDFYKVILLRDGALGLLDFFLRFPTPKNCKAQLLVPADLLFLVPDGWRPKIIAYRLASPRPLKVTKRLLFYGLVSDTFLSWPRFRSQMPDWIKQFPRDASVSAFFAVRSEVFNHQWTDRKTAFEFMSIFQRAFDSTPELLDATEFKSMLAKSDITYINMDIWRSASGLCSIDNQAFGQAVQVFPRGEYKGFTGKPIGSWPMSFTNSLELYTAEAADSDFSNFLFIKKSTPTSLSLPYPIVPKLWDLLSERLTLTSYV